MCKNNKEWQGAKFDGLIEDTETVFKKPRKNEAWRFICDMARFLLIMAMLTGLMALITSGDF